MKRYRWPVVAAAAVLMVAAVVFGVRWWSGSGTADCGVPPGSSVAGPVASPGSASAAAEYWTPERMRNASVAPMGERGDDRTC